MIFPGFPGVPPLFQVFQVFQVEWESLLFGKVFAKNCKKWKKFNRVITAPLDPPVTWTTWLLSFWYRER